MVDKYVYQYDKVDRVTSACYAATSCGGTGPWAGRIDYTYDLVGNRTSQMRTGTAGSDTIRYEYDAADQLTRQTTTAATGTTVTDFGYDAQGNQIKAGADRFEYHLDHSLAKATVAGKVTIFAHDAKGLRLTATTGSGAEATTQHWSWDINGTLPQITTETVTGPNGQLLATRGFSYCVDDEPAALLDPATGAHVYTHDWLGGVSDLVSPSGQVEQSYDYDPFGGAREGETLKDRPAATGPKNPLQFTGAYQDDSSGSGNYYLRARNYNPRTGRFTAVDPMPQEGGAAVSPYVYADNNPLAYAVDPPFGEQAAAWGRDVAVSRGRARRVYAGPDRRHQDEPGEL